MNKIGTEKFFRSGSERNTYEKTPGMSCMPGADVPYVRSRSGGDPSDQRESSSGIGTGMDRGASGGCDLRRGAVLPGYGIFLFCLSYEVFLINRSYIFPIENVRIFLKIKEDLPSGTLVYA